MSNELIARSEALQRLRNEGLNIAVEYGYLVVRDVPYVDAQRNVQRGILVSELQQDGTVAAKNVMHQIMFGGSYPCDVDGKELGGIRNSSARRVLHTSPDLVVDHSFSAKPDTVTYPDYHEKITTYLGLISGPASVLDPSQRPQTWPTIPDAREEAVFKYLDTASSRAKITALTQKLEAERVAIIGLGGTGSYVLDLVAKTPVREIHIFDKDSFSPHNAFRTPGAASAERLDENPSKVAYLDEIYSKMRNKLFPHEEYVDSRNAAVLKDMTIVFLCIDKNTARREIIDQLETLGISFIDCGMGVEIINEGLSGTVRATTSTQAKRDHVHAGRVDLSNDETMDDEYATNIQIADLNMLNAAMAVIRWKKLLGFYLAYEHEHHSTYTVEENMLTSEDTA